MSPLGFKHELISTSERPFWKHYKDKTVDGAKLKTVWGTTVFTNWKWTQWFKSK